MGNAESPVGLISDTHGLLRPEAIQALRDCSLIIHAGDVGSELIVPQLQKLAPTTAIRGNIDRAPWALALPLTATIQTGCGAIHVVHDIQDLAIDPIAEKIAIVVSGHSHRASTAMRDGVMYVNPGSAGRRRFNLPVTVAKLQWRPGLEVQLISLA